MPRELSLTVDGLCFAAQQWGEPDASPVLALHGWLDNSNSFAELAPHLSGVNLVAVDMAGHGRSDHRPGSSPYNIWEDVAKVFALAEALGWQRFSLLGHSRGAIVAALAAGTFPERIERLALIEGLFPQPGEPEKAPEQLAASITGVREQMRKTPTRYPSRQRAAKARENGVFPLSAGAALTLAERGVREVSGGYQWSSDRRLYAPSAVALTRAHTAAFIRAITAPTRLVLADSGLTDYYPKFRERAAAYPQIDTHTLSGGHHLHMEEAVASVAALINPLFE